MSEHYRFTIEFALRTDAPAGLKTALHAMHADTLPPKDATADLPGIVQQYLRPGGYPGDGVHIFEPLGQGHHLKLVRTFHDDELGNGGMYFPYWLFQFAASDGMIAMETGGAFGLPKIIVKSGDRLIETQLAYHPAEFWPLPGHPAPDGDQPIQAQPPHIVNLRSMLDAMDGIKDGMSV